MSSGKVVALTKANFDSVIREGKKPALVDFWAPWCGPCCALSGLVDGVAEAHPEWTVAKVNVDENPELAGDCDVRSLPTLLFFSAQGELVERSVGGLTKSDLLAKCEKAARA